MSLKPTSHAEAVAVFRAEVIGALTRRELARGELTQLLDALSQQRFRPPNSDTTRTYGVSTLQRWYYAYRKGGLEALEPKRRNDRGHARALSDQQRKLVLDIARENPRASAALILRTLVADGRIQEDLVSASTIQRFLKEHQLERARLRRESDPGRRRWQAARPGLIWHGDVCHGPSIEVDGKKRPLRIHGLLDDCSRYVIALRAFHSETEDDMLELFSRALRRHGRPKTLYLDNGSTYSGNALKTACARLQISLVHAAPYDPQARGKNERFWRTLRGQCIEHMPLRASSLHDVNVRLMAWLDRHYHAAPHSSLMGRSPGRVYAEQRPVDTELDEKMLREALTSRRNRRLRHDGTLSVDGHEFELAQSYLRTGRLITVAHCLLDDPPRPWVEHEEQRIELVPVDPVANSTRGRIKRDKPEQTVPFDPATALVDEATSRTPYHQETE